MVWWAVTLALLVDAPAWELLLGRLLGWESSWSSPRVWGWHRALPELQPWHCSPGLACTGGAAPGPCQPDLVGNTFPVSLAVLQKPGMVGELIPNHTPGEVPGLGRASFVVMRPWHWAAPRSQKVKAPNPGSFQRVNPFPALPSDPWDVLVTSRTE